MPTCIVSIAHEHISFTRGHCWPADTYATGIVVDSFFASIFQVQMV